MCQERIPGYGIFERWPYPSQRDWSSASYLLARNYLAEMHSDCDCQVNHFQDLEYLDNAFLPDCRGDTPLYYPSRCVQFTLKLSSESAGTQHCMISYHGTSSENLASILAYGLLPAGERAGGRLIRPKNGESLGPGVYTSPCPLYAQLYAPLEIWRGYYVQTIVQVVQSDVNVERYDDKGCAPTSLIGRNDIGRLYGGPPRCPDLQWKSWNHLAVRTQGIIVKIHDQDPNAPGGEYHRILHSLDGL